MGTPPGPDTAWTSVHSGGLSLSSPYPVADPEEVFYPVGTWTPPSVGSGDSGPGRRRQERSQPGDESRGTAGEPRRVQLDVDQL